MQRTIRWLPVVLLVVGSVAVAGNAPRDPNDSGWLGVMVGGSRDAGGEQTGVGLTRIIADGPAARARLRARDRIVAVDGVPVSGGGDLVQRIKKLPANAWVHLTVQRGDDDEREVDVRLGRRPERKSGFRFRQGWIGVQAIDLPSALREHFGAPADAGVMISEVAQGSPAEAAGLVLGDVVYEIDGEPVESVALLMDRIQGGGVGNTSELSIGRYGAVLQLETLIEKLAETR